MTKTAAEQLAEIAAIAATSGKTLIVAKDAAECSVAIVRTVHAPRNSVCIVSTKTLASGLAARTAGVLGLTSLDEADITDRRALERLAAWAAKPR